MNRPRWKRLNANRHVNVRLENNGPDLIEADEPETYDRSRLILANFDSFRLQHFRKIVSRTCQTRSYGNIRTSITPIIMK
jgi:hypothetical protein